MLTGIPRLDIMFASSLGTQQDEEEKEELQESQEQQDRDRVRNHEAANWCDLHQSRVQQKLEEAQDQAQAQGC
jgi:hypothetical protein